MLARELVFLFFLLKHNSKYSSWITIIFISSDSFFVASLFWNACHYQMAIIQSFNIIEGHESSHQIFQIITHKLNYEIININKIHPKHEYSSPIFQVHIVLKVDFLFHLFCLLVCIMRRCDQCECVYSSVSHRLQNA